MPHRPVLIKAPGKNRAPNRIKIHHRGEMTQGQRGQTKVWLPSGSAEQIVNSAGLTAATGVSVARPAVLSVPTEAIGAMLILGVNANTNTSGQVRLHVFRDRNSASDTADSAGVFTQEMGNNTWTGRSHCDAPLVDGGIYWKAGIVGTVNFDVFIWIVGWILE